MKRSPWIPAALLTLVLAASVQASPARSGSTRIDCWQYGVAVTQVTAGEEFQIRGTGFRPSMTHNVCIEGDFCMPVEVDALGTFTQIRRLGTAGTYNLQVYQPRNRQLESWILKTSTRITVVN